MYMQRAYSIFWVPPSLRLPTFSSSELSLITAVRVLLLRQYSGWVSALRIQCPQVAAAITTHQLTHPRNPTRSLTPTTYPLLCSYVIFRTFAMTTFQLFWPHASVLVYILKWLHILPCEPSLFFLFQWNPAFSKLLGPCRVPTGN